MQSPQRRLLLVRSHAHQKIPRHLKTQPRTRHTRGDFEQIRRNALVQTPETLLGEDRLQRVCDALVLVAHTTHRVDLEPPPQDVERVCAGLGDAAGDGARAEFADGGGVGLAFGSEVLADALVDHEVQADVRRDARDGGDYAAVEREDAAFGLVHGYHRLPHAGKLFGDVFHTELLKGGGLDGEARADDVERVGDGDGGDAGEGSAA